MLPTTPSKQAMLSHLPLTKNKSPTVKKIGFVFPELKLIEIFHVCTARGAVALCAVLGAQRRIITANTLHEIWLEETSDVSVSQTVDRALACCTVPKQTALSQLL